MWFGIAEIYMNLPMPLALWSGSLDAALMWHEFPPLLGVYRLIRSPLFVKILLIQSWLAMNILMLLDTGATPPWHGITAA